GCVWEPGHEGTRSARGAGAPPGEKRWGQTRHSLGTTTVRPEESLPRERSECPGCRAPTIEPEHKAVSNWKSTSGSGSYLLTSRKLGRDFGVEGLQLSFLRGFT